MAINSVASGSSTQAILPQPPADQNKRAELAKQAEQAKLAKQAEQTRQTQQPEEAKPQPAVNAQGQTTGSVIDTVA